MTDHDIAVNGGNITVRSYRPETNISETFAIMIWMHGKRTLMDCSQANYLMILTQAVVTWLAI